MSDPKPDLALCGKVSCDECGEEMEYGVRLSRMVPMSLDLTALWFECSECTENSNA